MLISNPTETQTCHRQHDNERCPKFSKRKLTAGFSRNKLFADATAIKSNSQFQARQCGTLAQLVAINMQSLISSPPYIGSTTGWTGGSSQSSQLGSSSFDFVISFVVSSCYFKIRIRHRIGSFYQLLPILALALGPRNVRRCSFFLFFSFFQLRGFGTRQILF